jgi:hypothetical protein
VLPEVAMRGSSGSEVASAAIFVPTAPKAMKKTDRQQQKPALGAHALPVAGGLVAQAQVLALDRVGVLARARASRITRASGRSGVRVMARPPRPDAFWRSSSPTCHVGSAGGGLGISVDGAELLGHQRQKPSRSKLISTNSRSRSGRLR